MVSAIEKQRREEYYYIRTSEAIQNYYQQLDQIELTQEMVTLWIDSLNNLGREIPYDKSLKLVSNDFNFKRFVLELNDYCLLDYLRENLPKYIFKKWYRSEYLEGMDVV
ncbi:hypothetical protein [Marinifilum flexuosum]|uniref:hypothetical protein n=1 Tax=Marinifilum flexuosum TaxID=1117708 RepID=UPI002490D426|nr:hypothetical protein [Marinifilum flexuosum]